jgi:beta-xylosidase
LQWQWHANHRADWFSLAARDGWLRLFAQPATGELARVPNLLTQKFPARAFRVETRLEFDAETAGTEAGLAVIGNHSATLAVQRTQAGLRVVYREGHHSQVISEAAGNALRFAVAIADGGRCTFELLGAGDAPVKGAIKFQAQAGKWIGAKIGIYCIGQAGQSASGHCDFDYFRFTAL